MYVHEEWKCVRVLWCVQEGMAEWMKKHEGDDSMRCYEIRSKKRDMVECLVRCWPKLMG